MKHSSKVHREMWWFYACVLVSFICAWLFWNGTIRWFDHFFFMRRQSLALDIMLCVLWYFLIAEAICQTMLFITHRIFFKK